MAVYTKPAISPLEQIELLKKRGLTILDESRAICFLEAVSFFRLTPYMRPFQLGNSDHQFKPGTKFSQLTRLVTPQVIPRSLRRGISILELRLSFLYFSPDLEESSTPSPQ